MLAATAINGVDLFFHLLVNGDSLIGDLFIGSSIAARNLNRAACVGLQLGKGSAMAAMPTSPTSERQNGGALHLKQPSQLSKKEYQAQ